MRAVFFVFLLVVGVLCVGIYLVFFMREVPGAAEERIGKLEDLPPDLGKWKTDEDSPEAEQARQEGLKREQRFWFEEGSGFLGQGRLVKQVRYRSLETNRIERVDPDQEIKRRRVKS